MLAIFLEVFCFHKIFSLDNADCSALLRRISFDPRTHKPRSYSIDLTHISMLIGPLPPCFRLTYSRSMPLFWWRAPYIVNVFLVVLSIFFNSSTYQLIIPAPHLNSGTAQVLIVWILFLPFNLDFNINLNLLLYSAVPLIYISCSFISSNSRMPR